ncbi:S-adenosylmethionine decarboxylase [Psychromonas sp. CNPT3]|uniref:S-adenosylmethionine decarboxylase n=1 Tax=Psychromonas sp. CNPT3 TaxID=314282 RepID=UPI00006E427C|nr:S-adenosylmethionine decarboxylase [Psychromonas sp. CNPT3]AGH82147.1 S-adenosylmethionine decarboxylase [Psychromonas sp. CNPT3]
MFYEGREKRLEIITQGINLLDFPVDFWHAMVQQAGACILGEIKENNIKAFILSESSLFIWENKLLLITCGTTHLLEAAVYFKKTAPKNSIKALHFQRHQANKPDAQKSTFTEDCAILQTLSPGNTLHWQDDYQGDIFRSNTYQPYNATTAILMLNTLSSPFATRLQNNSVSSDEIEQHLDIKRCFKDFHIHQHSFQPKGYSINGICGEGYFTLHLSPESIASYLSFESNLKSEIYRPFMQHLRQLFNPQKAYLMSFDNSDVCLKVLK